MGVVSAVGPWVAVVGPRGRRREGKGQARGQPVVGSSARASLSRGPPARNMCGAHGGAGRVELVPRAISFVGDSNTDLGTSLLCSTAGQEQRVFLQYCRGTGSTQSFIFQPETGYRRPPVPVYRTG